MNTEYLDLVQAAFSQYGIKEIPGSTHNETILQYAKEIGYGSIIKTDEDPWCAIAANWVLMKAGFERSGKLNARSFLEVGTEVKEPSFFDLVVLWRGSKEGTLGHVGFFLRWGYKKETIWVYGGNQNNRWQGSEFPSISILGFRRPKKIHNTVIC